MPETFLGAAGLPVPGLMQGVNQLPVWTGQADRARDEVLIENRHQPTRVHLRTYVDDRYKLTIYRDQPYGELFDLQADPGEVRNLWDDPGSAVLKTTLFHRFLNAELKREPTRCPRIAGAGAIESGGQRAGWWRKRPCLRSQRLPENPMDHAV